MTIVDGCLPQVLHLMSTIPRFLPDRPFPPYTYVPGQAPHPIRDPDGHLHGVEPATPNLNVDRWWTCDEYLWGIDLFNHGYYWEAHEAWEGLWHAAGRTGPVADFLKGLIKLAAAGVKTREGSLEGRRRHLNRAVELLTLAVDAAGPSLMGVQIAGLISQIAAELNDADQTITHESDPPGVFMLSLSPDRSH